jgi:hypothetical protein
MKFIQVLFATLAPGLIAAWDLEYDGGHESGRGDVNCQNLKHERGHHYRWDSSSGDNRDNKRCCVHLYDDKRCRGRETKHCKDYEGSSDYEYDSYAVDCGREAK